ncbi:MAG: insulinase family protein [Tannerella sp.]|jgi:predicted Zn-dependent peptidase|nr:insulinase family protein [Tannerella sp.]
MRKLILLWIPLCLWTACSREKRYETVSRTDGNGYAYEEVTNDPFKARIYTLANGLKVYLSKNADEPRIQTMIAVKVGSGDDPRDNTGLAHYLEHMMFKGSSHFGTADWAKEKPLLDSIAALFEEHKATQDPARKKEIYGRIDAVSQEAARYAISNEYDKIIGAVGASGTNAFTSYDMTVYVNEIPANEIDRFLRLEYDRFSNLQLRLFHTELETVYEEFNMYQDRGDSRIWNKLFEGLFAEHPYRVDVIGLPEHLKNPSMNSVLAFQKYFYVPNNMAVLMCGDLDFENTIQLVDRHFGQMEPNRELRHADPVVEAPLTAPKTFEVFTPDREQVVVGYRYGDARSREALYLNLIASIFYNGKAGLIDLDLLQQQKVLQMAAGAEEMKDYGIFAFMGTPREGQTLEEVSELIQGEIRKLKAGDFDEGLLEATVNNMKLQLVQTTDGRDGVFSFLESFINGVEWKDALARIDEMSRISKKELVAFAGEFFKDNYVTVYKRTGENREKVLVDKPHITAIAINRDEESDFARELLAMKPEPIEPVFLDYGTLVKKQTLKEGVDFYYTENVSNKIYSLDRFVEVSGITDKKLALAFRYLPYLGTSRYTPEALKMEMYRLAMDFGAVATSSRSYVSVSGLDETLERSLALMEEMMTDAAVNREAYDRLVDDILKQRANARLDKSQILRNGLVSYLKYGPKSAFTDLLSEAELKAIDPQELIDIIRRFASYRHGYFYYGPDSEKRIAGMLKKLDTPEALNDVPPRVEYPELPMDSPVVYFADYDMVQTEVMLLAKDVTFSPALMPYESMFNSYYGAGMNSIVFQEIREARGLAYSAYAYVSGPPRAGRSNYVQAYVGTQSDKMATAIDAFREMLTSMSRSEKAFDVSREYVLNNMRSERITKSDIFWNYMSLKDRGIDYDIRKPVFETIQRMKLDDVQQYFDEHIRPARYSVLLIGKRDRIDFDYLKKIAEVREVSLEELFGY